MFSIIDNQIKYGNLSINLPKEVSEHKIIKIYGTSTYGLSIKVGYIIAKKPPYVTVRSSTVDDCLLIGDANITDTVFLREQLDIETNKSFWLASKEQLDPQLNWITMELDNGKIYRFCPFTFKYTING